MIKPNKIKTKAKSKPKQFKIKLEIQNKTRNLLRHFITLLQTELNLTCSLGLTIHFSHLYFKIFKVECTEF